MKRRRKQDRTMKRKRKQDRTMKRRGRRIGRGGGGSRIRR